MKERYLFDMDPHDEIHCIHRVLTKNGWASKNDFTTMNRGEYRLFLKMIQVANHLRIEKTRYVKEENRDVMHLFFKQNQLEIVFYNYSLVKNRPVFRELNEKISVVRQKELQEHLKQKKLKLKRKKIATKATSIAALAMAVTLSFTFLGSGLSDKDDRTKPQNSMKPAQTITEHQQYDKGLYGFVEENLMTIGHDLDLESNLISRIGTMFQMNEREASEAIATHQDLVQNADLAELGMVRAVALEYWNKHSLSTAPKHENITAEEREQLIIDMAHLHGMTDPEMLATLLAIHRLETGYGTSRLCLEANNLGGVRDFVNGQYDFLVYPTQAAGAESFVRTVKNRCDELIQTGDYQQNKTIAQNIGPIYCTEKMSDDSLDWEELVDTEKQQILETDTLTRYGIEWNPSTK